MAHKRNTLRSFRMLARLQHAARLHGGKCLSTEYLGLAKNHLFLCRNKHTFPARGQHVLHSNSWCPYCAHGRVTDRNNLAAQHPEIAEEWHPTKNKLAAHQVTSTSQYSVWWLCGEGHEWRQGIYSRTKDKSKYTHGDCPTCGSLGIQAPHLISEWHKEKNGDLTPFDVRPFSNKKVWWECSRGHIWQAPVNNRFTGAQCQKCSAGNASSRREFRLVAEFQHIFRKVLHREKVDGVEADILLPSLAVAIEYDGKRWHRGKATADNKKTRFLTHRGYRVVRVREKGLPKVLGESVFVDPHELRKQDVDTVLRLIYGAARMPRRVAAYLERRAFVNEDGYLRLMETFPTAPDKNLRATHPALARQWSGKNAPLLPSAFSYGSNYAAWWQCEVDQRHEWQMPIKVRTGQDQGCPFCSGHRISDSNSLATQRKDLLRIWNYDLNDVSPTEVSIGSHRLVWWKCRRKGGHNYQMAVKAKVGGQGCAVCSGKQVVPELSFGALYPEQAKYWDKTRNGDLGPFQVTPFSGKRVFWSCHKGHRWELPVSKMTTNERGCLECKQTR